jgi:hypothetical protein
MTRIVLIGGESYLENIKPILEGKHRQVDCYTPDRLESLSARELKAEIKGKDLHMVIFCPGVYCHQEVLDDPNVLPESVRKVYCNPDWEGAYAATFPPQAENYPQGFDYYLLGDPQAETIINCLNRALGK